MSPKKSEPNQPRSHVFDGIQEYDNDLPRWWVALFVVTIVFSAGYLLWYHAGLFPAASLADEYDADVAAAKTQAEARASTAQASEFDYAAAARDAGIVAAGKESYGMTCAPCHGAEGQGVVGPNLTDDFWLHGSSAQAVEKVITSGALEKGMPAWGEVLGQEKIRQVVAYILKLQGTSPADAKAPQGEPGELR